MAVYFASSWVQSAGPELVADEDGDNDEVNSRTWSWPSGYKDLLALILPIFSNMNDARCGLKPRM